MSTFSRPVVTGLLVFHLLSPPGAAPRALASVNDPPPPERVQKPPARKQQNRPPARTPAWRPMLWKTTA